MSCVCMYDYHIAVAFDHWLRLKGDGGHSVTIYGSARSALATAILAMGERGGKRETDCNSEYLCD